MGLYKVRTQNFRESFRIILIEFYFRQFSDRRLTSDYYATKLILCFIFYPWDTAWNCVWSPINQEERKEKMVFMKHDVTAFETDFEPQEPLKIIADIKEKLANDPSGKKD